MFMDRTKGSLMERMKIIYIYTFCTSLQIVLLSQVSTRFASLKTLANIWDT